MKANRENLEEKLQRLLDERHEGDKVDSIFAESKQNGEDLHSIRETDSLLKSVSLDKPSEGFASRVMMHLDDVKIVRAVNKQAWLLLIGVFTCLLITGLLLNTVSPDLVRLPNGFSALGQDVNLEGMTGWFRPDIIIKGLMFVTFILGMLIFDRAVLRPFFDKRKVNMG